MPIYLAPISRRRFLARSLAAGAGLVLAPKSLRARTVDPSCWAFLSDLHLAADASTVFRDVNMANHFKTVSAELLALPQSPAGVFITGDCAYNRGEPGDYTRFKELLQPLREAQFPIHLALGNHDHRDHFWAAFPGEKPASPAVANRQFALFKTDLVNWLILDSLDKTQSTPGVLGPDQLRWLADILDANPNKPAVILVHHNPGLDGGNMGLKDTPEFLEVIRPRKQVKAYIFGHTHHWSVERDSSGIHFVNLPPVAYVFREGEPSGWVLATLKENSLRLELRGLDPTHKAHGQVFDLVWR
jgi:3',5'-cyclic-AMP phosphodiesterase